MIIKEIFYGIKCNRCGEIFEDGEHSFWSDESSAIENCTDNGWLEVNEKHYCQNCHEIDEETDEISVFEDYPKSLKTLNGFIDKILPGFGRKVNEYEDNFIITWNMAYSKTELTSYDIDYIKNLLGNKFISFDYIKGKYGATSCLLKIKK